jgi:hypothetical protein
MPRSGVTLPLPRANSPNSAMPRNEAETRYEKIDPVLRTKGYRLH